MVVVRHKGKDNVFRKQPNDGITCQVVNSREKDRTFRVEISRFNNCQLLKRRNHVRPIATTSSNASGEPRVTVNGLLASLL